MGAFGTLWTGSVIDNDTLSSDLTWRALVCVWHVPGARRCDARIVPCAVRPHPSCNLFFGPTACCHPRAHAQRTAPATPKAARPGDPYPGPTARSERGRSPITQGDPPKSAPATSAWCCRVPRPQESEPKPAGPQPATIWFRSSVSGHPRNGGRARE